MKFHRILLLVLLVLGVLIAWRFLPTTSEKNASKAPEGKRPVPVTTVAAATRDVPIWLSGLGTVQAYNKVTIRPRVSGVLDKINFTEGQIVNEGDVLAVIDPRPYESLLAQAKAKVAQTEAQLGNARQALDRSTSLVKTGAESRQVLDQAEANVAQFAAQQQADTAAVEAAQLNLDFTAVKAPISGRTGVRLIDQGNLVTASQDGGLVVVSQFQPISVIFTLPQDSLPALRKRLLGETEKPMVQSLNDEGQILAEGKMALIDNEIDINSGTLKLKATFPNTDLTLWPGQFLNARVLVETRKQAVVVPTQVITAGLDGPFVYIVKADKTVEPRNVKPGPRVDEITIIEEGLKAGEEIVLDGQSKLQPGAGITIQPSKL
ncbi:MAG: efflux RND transporter periplasmic adaptor subunit [Verrucomicrobiota bacterium]